ncbi:histidine kinase [Streptomyces sp. NPDC050560]|uniref:histidine kinase n=1 Tax=Streptomyces sp. NPDC050560 TaxID=3365630 RepID=UPI0037BBC8C7
MRPRARTSPRSSTPLPRTPAAAAALLRGRCTEFGRRVAATPVRARAGEGALAAAVVALVVATGWASHPPAALAAQGAATAVLVPLRRVLPGLLLLASGALLGTATLTFAVPVLAYGAVRHLSAAGRRSLPRGPLVLVSAAALVTLAITLPRLPPSAVAATPYALAYPVGMALLFLVAPAVSGTLVGQRQLLVRTLRERNRYLEHARLLTEARGRLRERARIAQEMHDLLGHRLTLITLYAGALELATEHRAPDLNEEVGVLAGTARAAMDELREVLGVLRQAQDSPSDPAAAPPEAGAPDGGPGFEEEVRDLVAGSRRAGLPVELRWHRAADAEPVPVVRRAVHRVIRESLTNVHKHAPTAPGVWVTVEVGEGAVRVAVGNGAAPGGRGGAALPGTGSGLIGLEERVRLLGGTLRHGRDPSGGFLVEAELPATGPGKAPAPDPAPVAAPSPNAASVPGTSPEPGSDALPVAPAPVALSPVGTSPGGGLDAVPPLAAAGEPPATAPGRLRGALGCTAALAVAVAGCASLWVWISSASHEAAANGDRYARVRTGMTRAEVRRITGAFAEGREADELRTGEPPRPRAADCSYALGIADRSPVAYRYCFSGDRLLRKDTYPTAGSGRTG